MVIGHQKILDYLRKSVAKDRVSHGYLFYGPEKVGKKKVAIEFAKILQCQESPYQSPEGEQVPYGAGKHGTGQAEGFCGICRNCQDIEKGIHPDLIFVQRGLDSQEIEISQIRDLRKTLSLSSYLGNYKIAIIDNAHNLNIEAANAFLKTLEEPKGKAVFILISAFPHLLPKTISSRLQQIKFSFVPNQIIDDYLRKTDLDESQQREILKMSSGRPGILQDVLGDLRKKDNYKSFMKNLGRLGNFDYNERFEYVKKISESRQDSIKFLEGLAIFFRDLFLIKSGASDFVLNPFLEKDLIHASGRYKRGHLQKILKLIKRLNEIISFSNVNPRLCLEVLMLEI